MCGSAPKAPKPARIQAPLAAPEETAQLVETKKPLQAKRKKIAGEGIKALQNPLILPGINVPS